MEELIANYSFLPWMRQGLATQLDEQKSDDSGLIIEAPLYIEAVRKVDNKAVRTSRAPIEKKIRLYGPGHIKGIESRAIIKTEPPINVRNFESNFFPYIEFYEEDFAWRYTPMLPEGDRLPPWLALIVLKDSEFEKQAFRKGDRLPKFSLTEETLAAPPFPPADQMWAWAHVHVNANLEDNGEQAAKRLLSLLHSNPNRASSRIICPRRLEPETDYSAFLIPYFERGRVAGLGLSQNTIENIDLKLPAWGHEQNSFAGFVDYVNQYPIYYEWSFRTGKSGEDFETMATKIKPIRLEEKYPNVGKRLVDIQSPGHNLHYEGGEHPNEGALLTLGALCPVNTEIENILEVETQEDQTFVEDLAALINLEEDLKNDRINKDHKYAFNPYYTDENVSIYDDPIITPPLYGRQHAEQSTVDPANKRQWVDQLNLDPGNRIAAGLGAEVVRRNQESYMDRAWGQFEQLFEVNQFLRRTQFALQINKRIHNKHLTPLSPDQLMAATAAAHTRIRLGNKTIRGYIDDRNVPNALFSYNYLRLVRPWGPLRRRAGNTPVSTPLNPQIAVSLNYSNRDYTLGEMASAANSALKSLIYNANIKLNGAIPEWKERGLKLNGNSGGASTLREGLQDFTDYFDKFNWHVMTKSSLTIDENVKDKIQKNIAPAQTYARRVKRQIPTITEGTALPTEKDVRPITAAPVFRDPTYRKILDVSQDSFVPNLDLIPNNTSSTLKVNRHFIESFMVGLNYEMARELRWREFPTDRRGTYFAHFWDSVDQDSINSREQKDVTPIHQWRQSPLGSHQMPGMVDEPLALVIRADLLKRYPNTYIYMQAGKKEGESSRIPDPEGAKLYPIFEAKVKPDIFIIGFNIEKEAALAEPGWFFVIAERPGEVHFGLDDPLQFNPEHVFQSWDDLNWAHLPNVGATLDLDKDQPLDPTTGQTLVPSGARWGWGKDVEAEDRRSGDGCGASMAWILYQKPFKIAIHAEAMILP